MLRKRTSFKPNLKQVAPQQAQTQTSTTTTTTSTGLAQAPQAGQNPPSPIKNGLGGAEVAEPVINDAAQQQLNPSTVSGSNQNVEQQQQAPTLLSSSLAPTNPPQSCNIVTDEDGSSKQIPTAAAVQESPDLSNQRVQEAITQLTGQKFEPIKSLSLRSSANKNVKLKDLLFFNPPMTKDQKRHKKSVCLAKKSEQKKSSSQEEEQQQPQSQTQTQPAEKTSNNNNNNINSEVETDTMDTTADEEHSLVPKVKMGPDGKLMLDESSTIINRKNLIKEQEAIVEDNEDIISRTNYDSFRRRPSNTSQTKWSLEDTKKFYHALTILGTDFSMMESLLFSGFRSRTELHKKFKREERVNKLKIDIALSNRISLNSEELEDLREIFYKQ